MVKVETLLKVADNSGAVICGCIQVKKSSVRLGAKPGQVITVSVKKNIFKKHVVKKSRLIRKKQIVSALVICCAFATKRWGNFFIRSQRNKIILLNQYSMPYATRLFGPIFREIRLRLVFSKIISMAQITF